MIGILGFHAQFQGLRLLNWTCSIAQLIALIITTILRAWVCRSMNKMPVAVPVNNDYILDNLALAIVGKGGSKFPNPEALRAPGLLLTFGVNNIPKLRAITKAESKDQGQPVSRYSNRSNAQPANPVLQSSINVQPSTEKPSLAQQAPDLRVRLGCLSKWTGAKSQEAINLSNSIEAALERLSPQKQFLVWRALTRPDTFWSSECTEQQAFVFYLFSAFMWATMEFIVSASQFHFTMVIISRERPDWSWARSFCFQG